MIKDCTKEMKELKSKIGMFWLAFILYGILSVNLLSLCFKKFIFGIPAVYIAALGIIIGVNILFRYLSPRCPNCGHGLYSAIEIKKYPVVLKSWISKNCYGCGAKLKT